MIMQSSLEYKPYHQVLYKPDQSNSNIFHPLYILSIIYCLFKYQFQLCFRNITLTLYVCKYTSASYYEYKSVSVVCLLKTHLLNNMHFKIHCFKCTAWDLQSTLMEFFSNSCFFFKRCLPVVTKFCILLSQGNPSSHPGMTSSELKRHIRGAVLSFRNICYPVKEKNRFLFGKKAVEKEILLNVRYVFDLFKRVLC